MMVQVGGLALSCHIDGLTVEQWFICLAFALITIPWRYVVVLCPVTRFMPLLGEKEQDDNEDAQPLTTRQGSGDPQGSGS